VLCGVYIKKLLLAEGNRDIGGAMKDQFIRIALARLRRDYPFFPQRIAVAAKYVQTMVGKETLTCITCKRELYIRFFYKQKRERRVYFRTKCKMCYSIHRRIKGY
jgi:hypothetical protein